MQNMKLFWHFGLLLLCPISSYQSSSVESPSYIGAVVEYSPIKRPENGKSIIELNTENYLKFISRASEYAVDILVFPESSLSIAWSTNQTISRTEAASYVPDPHDNISPCEDRNELYTDAMKNISCAAKMHRMYIVINHREKVACNGQGCPADGYLVYNTNVAFDRNGTVIARYRKYNLFGEQDKNTTSEPILSTFKTDFGVTFGQFICFDILFQTPTLNYTRNLGVTDIIYSAHWFSELPYLFSIESQAAWAYATDVNFLASGHNDPRTASGGSGIYIGRKGYSHTIHKNKGTNVLIVSEIPKVINGKRALNINQSMVQIYEFKSSEISTTEETNSGIYMHLIDYVEPYTTELIDLNQNEHDRIICDRGLCCRIKLKLTFDSSVINSNASYYRYRFAVFHGTRTFSGVRTAGLKICGIISCTNDSLDGCVHIFDTASNIAKPTTFESIEISMQEEDKSNTFYMPITFSKDIAPLNASSYLYESSDSAETTNHVMKLTEPRSDLLTFSLYCRNFPVDGTPVTSAVSDKFATSPLILLANIISLLVLFGL